MELRQYLRIVWKWLWLIILGTLLAGGVAYGVSSQLPPVYRVSTILLARAGGEIGDDYSAIMASEHLAAIYKELLTNRANLESIASALGLGPLETRELLTTDKVEASLIPNTSLIRLTVEDSDPYVAMEIANEVVAAFAQTLRELGGVRGKDLIVVDPVRQPLEPVAPRKLLNTLVATIGGCALAVGTAFLIEYLDDTLDTAEDIHQSLSLTPLVAIPYPNGREKRGKTPVAVAYPSSSLTEAYRTLRARIQSSQTNGRLSPAGDSAFARWRPVQFPQLDGPLRTLLITGPSPQEESVNVVANLGVVMAQAVPKVLLVDADLRQPELHRPFALSNRLGLSSVLEGKTPLDKAIQKTEIDGVHVMTGGPVPPDPPALLGSQQMVQFIKELQTQADFVLFNTPPVLAGADTMILASQVDGTMLVIESRSTRPEVARQAMERLHSVRAKMLGVILNGVRGKQHRH